MAEKCELKFSCACGRTHGVILEKEILYHAHFICMCDDCQSFAHYLGKSKEVLDANGGTDISPISPADIKFTAGSENLRCVRLHEKGMYRWYADCCKTPIANAMVPKMGYIGFLASTFSPTDREKYLGPVRARVMAKFGIPPLPKDAHQKTPLSLVGAALKGIFRMITKGLKRPSPFFDPTTDIPISKPYVLSMDERQKILKAVELARN